MAAEVRRFGFMENDLQGSGNMIDENELVKRALEARKHAYVPYSHWAVGAALLTKEGTVYEGCNIENAAHTPTNCAERTAFFKAVSEGERDFAAIAVVGAYETEEPEKICAPCGVCRQVMMEFCDPDTFRVILGTKDGVQVSQTLKEMLPYGFGPDVLNTEK